MGEGHEDSAAGDEPGAQASVAAELTTRARHLDDLVNGRPENVETALPQFEAILAQSTDPDVVVAAVVALGHACDQRAARLLLDHVKVDNGSVGVRLALAQALPSGVTPGDATWQRVVDALITLSGDGDADVRDWACFGLGQVEAASQEARDALAVRLNDVHDDVRCEALLALARTGDPRARERLLQRLAADDSIVHELELQAAAELADPALHPLLMRLSLEWEGDDDDFMPILDFALARCRPEAQVAAEEVERALLARVQSLFAAENFMASLVGRYPRSGLIVRDSDEAQTVVYEWPIWDDEEPMNYPLEQQARSVLLTALNNRT